AVRLGVAVRRGLEGGLEGLGDVAHHGASDVGDRGHLTGDRKVLRVVPGEARVAMAVDARASPQLRREVTLGGCRDACEDREQDELVEGRLVAEARAEGLDVLRLD